MMKARLVILILTGKIEGKKDGGKQDILDWGP